MVSRIDHSFNNVLCVLTDRSEDDFELFCATIKNDKLISLVAVAKNGHILRHLSDPLRSHKTVVFAAVENAGMAIHHAAAPLKADKAVALAAINSDSNSIFEISPSLRYDKKILKTYINSQKLERALYAAKEQIAAEIVPSSASSSSSVATSSSCAIVCPASALFGNDSNADWVSTFSISSAFEF